jgi:stage V sporulation protein AA
MTFNNDGSVSEIFQDVDRLILGNENRSGTMDPLDKEGDGKKKTKGIMILEISYSVGLIVGVTLFFNHFCKRQITLDPTPIEVQMRLYEDQVDTTVIQNASRKEKGVDVQ